MHNEYPRPQLIRDEWLCLNGQWNFTVDSSDSGIERQLYLNPVFEKSITVPFCPESALSGINCQDFMTCVWYERTFTLPAAMRGKRILLHFEAADFDTSVWCNGCPAGRHLGGYTPFSFEITELLNTDAENQIVVRCYDDARSLTQAAGKQCGLYNSLGCLYTRTTGIWQTVWLEAVPDIYVTRLRYQTDLNAPALLVTAELSNYAKDLPLNIHIKYEGRDMGAFTQTFTGRHITAYIPLAEKHLWECGYGRLYDVLLQAGGDQIKSYFGLRDVSLDGKRFLINGRPVFQRLVLDQGFYPDGIYTAPTDEALKKDIELSMAAGFNGARLHQKIFERRFLYHADRAGYLIWGEYPSWGLDIHTPGLGLSIMLPEWIEALERDVNHPCVIGWCPLNETTGEQDASLPYALYQTTRAIDPTRPVIDASGHLHVISDVWDEHDYTQNPETFGERYSTAALRSEAGRPHPNPIFKRRAFSPGALEREGGRPHSSIMQYNGGMPFFVSEYGGIWWNPLETNGWGYGENVRDEEGFYQRLESLTDAMLNNPDITAFCYTQLTDVEQEQNGIYFYDRSKKFDMDRVRRIFSKPAAIERQNVCLFSVYKV